uniref:Uncharacterized protein n=1 Tax=Murine herpesvirus TaxID=1431748 RepID=A0A6M4EG01_9BETA
MGTPRVNPTICIPLNRGRMCKMGVVYERVYPNWLNLNGSAHLAYCQLSTPYLLRVTG